MRKERPRAGAGTADCGEPGAPALGDVLEFMRLIWGVSHGLQSTSKRMEAELGITGPQRLVVRILGRCPGVSARALAHTLRLHPSTLTGVLRRLEDRGIIERRPWEHDRREVRLRLTAVGRRVDRRHRGTVEEAVQRTLADLRGDQIRAASEVLVALNEALATGATRRRAARRH